MPLITFPSYTEVDSAEAQLAVDEARSAALLECLRAPGIVRRPDRDAGVALELLGHAIEYLVDSRMFLAQIPYTRAEEEAIQTLMRCSRTVFAGCPEVVSLRKRLARRLERWLATIW